MAVCTFVVDEEELEREIMWGIGLMLEGFFEMLKERYNGIEIS